VDELFNRVAGEAAAVRGVVSYAMPESCLFAGHFAGLLTERQRRFPGIDVRVRIVAPEKIHDLIAEREVDFGFVTSRRDDARFEHRHYVDEEYILVTPDRSQVTDVTAESLRAMPFIAYPGAAEMFGLWRGIHLPRHHQLNFADLTIRGSVDSLFGVLTMLEGGVGAAVLPGQCTSGLVRSAKKNLGIYSDTRGRVATHPVWIATLAGDKRARRVDVIIDAFMNLPH